MEDLQTGRPAKADGRHSRNSQRSSRRARTGAVRPFLRLLRAAFCQCEGQQRVVSGPSSRRAERPLDEPHQAFAFGWRLYVRQQSAASARWGSLTGRVDDWRGGDRCCISVAAPFGSRCPTSHTVAPFPVAAHRTGHADFPHPALGQDLMLSPTEGRVRRCRWCNSQVRVPGFSSHGPSRNHPIRPLPAGRFLEQCSFEFSLRFHMACTSQRLKPPELCRVAPISVPCCFRHAP